MVGVHAAFTLFERHAGRRCRPRRSPWRRRAHPRRGGPRRRRRAGPPRRPHPRRLDAHPRRAPRRRPWPAGHDRAQSSLEPEQRGRVRPPSAVLESDQPRHGWHRRRHAGRVPTRVRGRPVRRCHGRTRRGLVVARTQLAAVPRGAQRRGHVVVCADGPVASRLHARRCERSTWTSTASLPCATAAPPASTPTRSERKAAEHAARLHARL